MPRPWQFLSILLALPASISAISFDCEHIRVDGKSFHLKALGGPKEVNFQEYRSPSIHNTTFTVDICNGLKRDSSIPKEDQCPHGTRVCGIKRIFNDGTNITDSVIPIAGAFDTTHALPLDPEYSRLKDGSSNMDAEREGIRITLNGGRFPFENTKGQKQKAIIEFVCNKTLTGNEGFGKDDAKKLRRDDDDNDDDDDDDHGKEPKLPDLDEGKSLRYISYKTEDDVGVLRLQWETKHACEDDNSDDSDDGDDGDESPNKAGWGFFTWFIIVVFLLAAAYIIFGSWLNYNRYGARGWDLIPHGDTIRDLPYTLREWAHNLTSRLRGGDSRGGYSAV